MNDARFLVLEGVDGVGKSTQLAALADWLRTLGHHVVTCRDPGSTPTGESIRNLLLHSQAEMEPCAEMLLYMAARAELVAQVIRPALDRGNTVVCDRYLLSNVVYQGVAGGLPLDTIWQVGQIATGGLYPHLSIVLDLPESIASQRRGPDADRMEGRGSAFLHQVQQGFVQLARLSPPFPVVVVDAGAEPQEVHRRVQQVVAPYLATQGLEAPR